MLTRPSLLPHRTAVWLWFVSAFNHIVNFLQGLLKGHDQTANVILQNCVERVYSTQGVESVPLGLYIIRGDNMWVPPYFLHVRSMCPFETRWSTFNVSMCPFETRWSTFNDSMCPFETRWSKFNVSMYRLRVAAHHGTFTFTARSLANLMSTWIASKISQQFGQHLSSMWCIDC